MVIAFFGVDGRSFASHLAILFARTSRSGSVDLIRVTRPGEANLPRDARIDEPARVVELELPPEAASVPLDRALSETLAAGRTAVLDLPGASLSDLALCARRDVERVVPVAGSRLDLRAVASAFGPHAGGVRPAWILAQGGRAGNGHRVGIDAAIRRERPSIASLGLRLLPLPLPRFTMGELDAIVEGEVGERAAGFADALRERLDAHSGAGREVRDGVPAIEDRRGTTERLRDLADQLDAFEDGIEPNEAELAAAPLLEDWRPTSRATVALSGRVSGHPSKPSGAIETSELFATDGATFARTFSRLYRLGRPLRGRSR